MTIYLFMHYDNTNSGASYKNVDVIHGHVNYTATAYDSVNDWYELYITNPFTS